MLGFIKNVFGGSDALGSIERVASEWIETDKEQAEAKTLMIKALDPNGLMRRKLSERVTALYTVYILTMLLLIIAEAWGFDVSVATGKIMELFGPITGMTGAIIAASFGVNGVNSFKGK